MTTPTPELVALLVTHEDLCRMWTSAYRSGHHDTVEGGYTDVFHVDAGTYWAESVDEFLAERDEPTRAATVPQGVWLPIESAPEVKGDCFWCQLAWGPEGDQSTGCGFRWDGKWYAAGCFYQIGQERKFGWREVEIQPTHWMPKTEAPPPAELGKES